MPMPRPMPPLPEDDKVKQSKPRGNNYMVTFTKRLKAFNSIIDLPLAAFVGTDAVEDAFGLEVGEVTLDAFGRDVAGPSLRP